jgi:hypothetical protein
MLFLKTPIDTQCSADSSPVCGPIRNPIRQTYTLPLHISENHRQLCHNPGGRIIHRYSDMVKAKSLPSGRRNLKSTTEISQRGVK